MSVHVKICGINSVESADASIRAGADYAGLVFHSASPRRLVPEQAGALASRLRGRLRIVALLADASDDAIAAAIAAVHPDMLQLHGCETVARVGEIAARTNLPIIKAVPIADATDVAGAIAYEAVADMLLLDAKAPVSASRAGGHGVAFDWQLLRGRTFSRPWFLAGGLNPDNVCRAIAVTNANAVDVSSGVETAPGVKSPDLIAAFVSNARAATLAHSPA